jgi:YidC/Oxa1 family membrane protein insertase
VNGLIALVATPVATVLRGIHAVLSTFLIPGSGPAWGLSIVLLTICVRLVLFPLFVKQIKSQRRMQELAPKVKELQVKHKGDRETLNAEMMKLYKDNNANPVAGCLPLLLQLPVFFALFSVIREFKPGAEAKYGLTANQLTEGGRAKVFGAPLSAAFKSSSELLASLGGNPTTVKIVATAMIVLMGATTFWTQRQMMARTGPAADPTQAQVQKLMLYVLPFSFAIFGFSFPVGVLLYWLTTNVWSMGQQAYVIKHMPPIVTGGTAGASRTAQTPQPSSSAFSRLGRLVSGQTSPSTGTQVPPSTGSIGTATAVQDLPSDRDPDSGDTLKPPPGGAAAARGRQAGSRKNKRRRGGR